LGCNLKIVGLLPGAHIALWKRFSIIFSFLWIKL
jgi:hypothetical protein